MVDYGNCIFGVVCTWYVSASRTESNGRDCKTRDYWRDIIFWRRERAISNTLPDTSGANFDISTEAMDITATEIYRNNIPLRRSLGLQMACISTDTRISSRRTPRIQRSTTHHPHHPILCVGNNSIDKQPPHPHLVHRLLRNPFPRRTPLSL